MKTYIDSTNLELFNSYDDDVKCYMRYQETEEGAHISFEEEGFFTWLRAAFFCRKQYNLQQIVPKIDGLIRKNLLRFTDRDEEKDFYIGLYHKISKKFVVNESQKLEKRYTALFAKMHTWNRTEEDQQPSFRVHPQEPPAPPEPSLFQTSPNERHFLIRHILEFFHQNKEFREELQKKLVAQAPSKEEFINACKAKKAIEEELHKMSQEDLEQAYRRALPDNDLPLKSVPSEVMIEVPDQQQIEQNLHSLIDTSELEKAYKLLHQGKECPKQDEKGTIDFATTRNAISQKVRIDDDAYRTVFDSPRPKKNKKRKITKKVTDRAAVEQALLDLRLQPAENAKKQYILHSMQTIFTLLDQQKEAPDSEKPLIPYQALLTDIHEHICNIDTESPVRTLFTLFQKYLEAELPDPELFQSFALIKSPPQAPEKPVERTPFSFLPNGLHNAGNSCYLNATMQTLMHSESVYNFILQKVTGAVKPTPAQFAAACEIAQFRPPNNPREEQDGIRALFTFLHDDRPYPEATEEDCRRVNQQFTPEGRAIRSAEMATGLNREKLEELSKPMISSFLAHSFFELMEESRKSSSSLSRNFSRKMRLYAIQAGFAAVAETSQEDGNELFQFLSQKIGFPLLAFKQGERAMRIEQLLGDEAPVLVENNPALRVMPPHEEDNPITPYPKIDISRNLELVQDFLEKNEGVLLREVYAARHITHNADTQRIIKNFLRHFPRSFSCRECALLLKKLPLQLTLTEISQLIDQFQGPDRVIRREPLRHSLHGKKTKGEQFVAKLKKLEGRLPENFQKGTFAATSLEELNQIVERLPEEEPRAKDPPQPPPSLQDLLSREHPTLLMNAPHMLPIQIERFDDERNKVLAPLTIPPKLTLPVEEEGGAVPYTYHLRAITVHAGGSIQGGHYYNYTVDPKKPDRMYHFDDSFASSLSQEEAGKDITRQATLALYERDV